MPTKMQKAQTRGEVTLSQTKYATGPLAGLNRRARLSLGSSRMPEGGMRPHAMRAMEANVKAMEKTEEKSDGPMFAEAGKPVPELTALMEAANLVNEKGGTPDGFVIDGVGYGSLAPNGGSNA